MILGICEVPETLKVLKLVKTILLIIRIVVPILIIIFGMKNYMNAIKNDDELVKANKKLVIMSISAAILLFIPTFVNIVLKLVSTNNKDYYSCMQNATLEGISIAYTNMATRYVESAENTISRATYQEAKNYLKNVDNTTERNSLESRLDNVEVSLDIVDDINNLTSKNFSEQSKKIEERINMLNDENAKDILKEKLNEAKERIYKFAGNYPIVPFGEIDLYKNLKYFSGSTLSSLLEKNGSSVEELNEKIKSAVELAGVGTREATVSAAITLIGSIAEYGYRLPYYWGGKRNNFGVDGNWGVYSASPYCNDYYFDTQAAIDHCIKDMSYRGLDCSGFVNWSVVQGTQKQEKQGVTNNGTNVTLNPNKAVCKIGDALATSGHITLIVGIDDANKRYIIAEESSGMEIRSVPYNGIRGGKKYWCEDLSHNYIN